MDRGTTGGHATADARGEELVGVVGVVVVVVARYLADAVACAVRR